MQDCNGCKYYFCELGGTFYNTPYCHYLLTNYERRKRDENGNCLSYEKGKKVVRSRREGLGMRENSLT